MGAGAKSHERRGYFCSKLVADFLQYHGAITKTHAGHPRPCDKYAPLHFSGVGDFQAQIEKESGLAWEPLQILWTNAQKVKLPFPAHIMKYMKVEVPPSPNQTR